MTEPDLNAALSLRSPEEGLRLYRDWAATYDAGFAAGMDYLLPAHVAGAYLAAGGQGPVLDVGAGTGLLAQALRDGGFAGDVDAADLSPEMLAVAAGKGIYRHLICADITQPLPPPAGRYQGIVSSGTFTHGHVGPEALAPLLSIAEPGALVALSINAGVYVQAGFDRALQSLAPALSGLQLIEVEIYGAAAVRQKAAHADDRALIALFRIG